MSGVARTIGNGQPPWTASPTRFALAAVGWSLALFTVFRRPWVERQLILPLTEVQQAIAAWYGASGALPIAVTVECSATDVIALFLGVALAYPAAWRSRLGGIAGGIGLILALNTVRIGTLTRAAGSPALFAALHVYVWPTVLVLAMSAYTFAWMWRAGRQAPAGALAMGREDGPGRLARFAVLALALLGVFAAAAPWIMESAALLRVASWVARVVGTVLVAVGIPAVVSGNGLWTPRGAFLITQDCVATPLVPLYVAAALTLPGTWGRRSLAVLATAPLFLALGVVRTLLVALPPALAESPLLMVHAFYQLLAAGIGVGVAALWQGGLLRETWGRTTARALGASSVGLGLGIAAGGVYTRAIAWASGVVASVAAASAPVLAGPQDPQGALWLLPGYQASLLVALAIALWPRLSRARLAAGLGLLAASQVVLLVVIGGVATHLGYVPHALLIRAWALAGPGLTVVLLSGRAAPRSHGP